MNRILALILFFMSSVSMARVVVYDGQPIAGLAASSNHTSDWINTRTAQDCSFEMLWSGLSSTIDGQFVIEVSNSGASNATPKSSASLTVTTASGNDMFSLNGVISEKFYRIKWVKNTVAAGTVTVNAICKG